MQHTLCNDIWTFSYKGSAFQPVTLPHDFTIGLNRESTALSGKDAGWFAGGAGVYQTELAPCGARHAFLLCHGCYGLTEIWVGGNRAVFHPNGYTPIVAEITKYAACDQPVPLRISVNNQGQPSARWYTGAGLYRGAELLTSSARAFIPVWGLYAKTMYFEREDAVVDITVSVQSEAELPRTVGIRIADDADDSVFELQKPVMLIRGQNEIRFRARVRNAKRWSADTPYLYRLHAYVQGEGEADRETMRIGLCTICLDADRGLFLNGEHTVLRGGCVHHDNGPIGAVSVYDAEYRRISYMKRMGFNAIRCSHNPPSTVLLDVCDELGMLVVDEAFDCWRHGKVAFDYHIFFDQWHEDDLRSILLRDRNHPSVILWSQGNEIVERGGHSEGYAIAAALSGIIRSLDDKPITHALCSFWDDPQLQALQAETENDAFDVWAQRTAGIAQHIDVFGYNYDNERIARDRVIFPDRLSLITESVPKHAADSWRTVENHPDVIGDMVWTAWDYFGESGLGHIEFGKAEARGLMPYPWHQAHCGDFDLCGVRRPQSYYRQIAWGLRSEPYITSADPDHSAIPYAISLWGFYDGVDSWFWPGREGKRSEVRVYARGNKAVFSLNGKPVAEAPIDESYTAAAYIPYAPGKLSVAVYRDQDVLVGTASLATPGSPEKLAVAHVDFGRELLYFSLEIQDHSGMRVPLGDRLIHVGVSGGAAVAALGTGNPVSEEPYATDHRTAYEGRLLAVVRAPRSASFTLTAQADQLSTLTYLVDRSGEAQ